MADPMTIFWLGIASFVVIGTMTLIWKVNPYFRVIEQIIIGGGTAHLVMYGLDSVNKGAISPIAVGRWLLIVPLFLGILMLGRVTPWKWTARYPTAILIGTGIGIMVAGIMEAQVIGLIRGIGAGIIGSSAGTAPWFLSIFTAVSTVTAITYFFYTKEHKGMLGKSTRYGRIVLMAGFGVSWGAEVGWFITAFATNVEYIVKFIKGLLGMPI